MAKACGDMDGTEEAGDCAGTPTDDVVDGRRDGDSAVDVAAVAVAIEAGPVAGVAGVTEGRRRSGELWVPVDETLTLLTPHPVERRPWAGRARNAAAAAAAADVEQEQKRKKKKERKNRNDLVMDEKEKWNISPDSTGGCCCCCGLRVCALDGRDALIQSRGVA